MTTKNGVKEVNKCQVTSILVNIAENSYLLTTTYVHTAEKSTQLALKDAPNAEIQLKPDKSNAVVAVWRFKQTVHTVENQHFSETTAKAVVKDLQ